MAEVEDVAETGHRDLREVADEQPAPVLEDVVRVPDAEETADSVEHAGRVLDEILYRGTVDDAEETDHRAEELNRWHDDQDAVAEHETAGWDDSED
ncbi:hypothetical protein [Pseudonocardia phyllosphaerae]|uniref:hypothetical protein n=1 Tax=Pseudonocardia phyllosphaerae TaxID=3390502 RepID=UPI00397E1789